MGAHLSRRGHPTRTFSTAPKRFRRPSKFLRVAGCPHSEAPAARASAWARTSSLQLEAHGETLKAGKEHHEQVNKHKDHCRRRLVAAPSSSGSTLIPGLWPPPDRSVFRVWVPVYFASEGTFHAVYLLRGCGVSTPHF